MWEGKQDIIRRGKSSHFGRVPWGAGFSWQMPSSGADSLIPWDMLLLSLQWNTQKKETNWSGPSKTCPWFTTCPCFVLFSLTHTSRTPQGETFVRQNATTLLLAKHGGWCEHTCRQISVIHAEWVSSDAQVEALSLPATEPLEIVVIDILEPLPRTTKRNQLLVIITAQFSKLTRVIPKAKINSTQMKTISLNIQVMQYEIPSYVMTAIRPLFMSRLFTALCLLLPVKKLTTIAYHPQTSGQVEWDNSPMAVWLRNFVSERHRYWDTYAQSLTFAYNTLPHRATGTLLFNVILPRELPSAAKFGRSTTSVSDMPKDAQSRHETRECLNRWSSWMQ